MNRIQLMVAVFLLAFLLLIVVEVVFALLSRYR